MNRFFFIAGCIAAMVAVALGAFAAHGLADTLVVERLEVFRTGVTYQFYHAFALIVTALVAYVLPRRWVNISGWLFLGGIFFFSGSLYVLALREWIGFPVDWIGPITPIGGLLFIGGWGVLAWAAFPEKQNNEIGEEG